MTDLGKNVDDPNILCGWKMFAEKQVDGKIRHVYRFRAQVKMCEEPRNPVNIIEVIAKEHSQGTFYGWLDNKPDATPSMIWPSMIQLEMCFPYGSKVEIDRGRGRILRLEVTEA